MARKKNQYPLVQMHFFFPNIFSPYLVESTDIELRMWRSYYINSGEERLADSWSQPHLWKAPQLKAGPCTHPIEQGPVTSLRISLFTQGPVPPDPHQCFLLLAFRWWVSHRTPSLPKANLMSVELLVDFVWPAPVAIPSQWRTCHRTSR